MIRFLDLEPAYAELKQDIDSAYFRVVSSGRYLLGPELETFEAAWATHCGSQACVGVGSGLDALVLALRALEIGPGDEVIVPSHTFIATWLAVTQTGATIVPVEPESTTFNICARDVARVVTEKTAAIIAVHLYGLPADVVGLETLSKATGIPLVFDAAQAHGATVDGLPVGQFGTLTAWSFYPGKNLGALGDGGAVTCSDPVLAGRVRLLRNYGSIEKYSHQELGTNSRLDEFQAAVLLEKLAVLEEWNSRRRAIAKFYSDSLEDLKTVLRPPSFFSSSAWHLYVIRVANRDAIVRALSEAGVETGIHYPTPPSKQAAYGHLRFGQFAIAERLAREVLSLPIGPHLLLSDAKLVVNVLRDALARFGEEISC